MNNFFVSCNTCGASVEISPVQKDVLSECPGSYIICSKCSPDKETNLIIPNDYLFRVKKREPRFLEQ